MNMPLVSVIVATYRRADELKLALQSVSAQTYKNIELIIVDDNADEKWNKEVQKIVATVTQNTRLQFNLICNNSNQGSANTRNIGINAAHGDYICFLDDDDIFLPERIQNQVVDMVRDGADYGITDLALYNEDGSICEIRKRKYLVTDERDNLILCHLKYHMTGTDTLMFKRKYLLSFGAFDPIDCGDEYYLMMKAIMAGGKLSYSPVCDVKAYVHTGEGGISSGKGKIDGENLLFEYKKKFFNEIKLKDRRYIMMRHYAVLAFAYKRSGNLGKFFICGIKSFFCAPCQCVGLLVNLK